MNDSFLEDLELVPTERKPGGTVSHAERNITRRRSQPSPVQPMQDREELNLLMAKQNAKPKVTSATLATKVSRRRSEESKETARPGSRITETGKSRVPERRTKLPENKLKPVENVAHIEPPTDKRDDKERPRWSGGSNKESGRCSDGSSKENSRPSDSSRESVSQPEPAKERVKGSSDGHGNRKESVEKFEVAMLNSVKEIVSTYTKNESTKILRAMQELYVNSQANLIKLMLQQTDEIVNEGNSGKDSPRVRSLLEENFRLRENIAILEARNEEFKRTVEESEQIKQENLQLKLRCNELLK